MYYLPLSSTASLEVGGGTYKVRVAQNYQITTFSVI